MDCKHINHKLIFFLEKSLPVPEMQQIKAHLDECEACRQLAEKLESTLQVIEDEKKVTINPFLYSKVMQKIENRKEQKYFIPAFSLINQIKPVYYSIIMVIGILLGIGLGNLAVNQSEKSLANIQMEEIYFNDFQQETIENILLNDNE